MRANLVLLTFALLFSSASAQWGHNVDSLATILPNGSYLDIAVEGDRLYAATYFGFEIFDISNPADIRFLSRTSSIGDAYEIAVREGFVYLGDYSFGMHTYDARDPQNVMYLNTRHFEDVWWEEILAVRSRLYVSEFNYGVTIFDISNPALPTRLGLFRNIVFPGAIYIGDSLSYVYNYQTDEVAVTDLRTVGQWRILSRLNVGGYVASILEADSLLILCRGRDGISFYSREDPLNPRLCSTVPTNGQYAYKAVVVGSLVYAAVSRNGLMVLDAANLDSVVVISQDNLPYPRALAFHNNHIFVGRTSYGLGVYALENPLQPVEISSFRPDLWISDVTAYNGAIYIPRLSRGLLTLDGADPSMPDTAELNSDYAFYEVESSGDGWLYARTFNAADTTYLLTVFSLADPLHPEEVWNMEIEPEYFYLKYHEGLLALYDWEGSIMLLDAEDRAQPNYLTEILDASPHYIHLTRGRLYVVNSTEPPVLLVYDLDDPERPVLAGQYRGLEFGYGLTSLGQRIYASDGNHGVIVLDAADPTNIRRIASTPTNWATDVFVSDSLLYLADADRGLKIFDITTSVLPTYLGHLETPGWAYELFVRDGICYINDDYDLTIARYIPLDVGGRPFEPPLTFFLAPAYPNPFNSAAQLTFGLAAPGWARLSIFDAAGRFVLKQDWPDIQPGRHKFLWNASSRPAGVYIFRLETGLKGSSQASHRTERPANLIK